MEVQHGKEILLSLNKKKIGKGVKIGEGGFGKIYKITKSKKNGTMEPLKQQFVQKQTRIFDEEGELIGQNLKEIFIGLDYFKHENTQIYDECFIIEDLDEIENSHFGINMSLADMTFYELSILPFTNQERIDLFYHLFNQIIKGISYIHSKCVCHADIKPENILVYNFKFSSNNYENYENAKKAILKINDYSGVNLEYNNTMDKVSTVYYKAPELFQDTYSKFQNSVKYKFGPFNDVWSIGIMMLEFLYGENIIERLCKNAKKQYKIKDSKTALVKIFGSIKSINVIPLLKMKGYDIENEDVKKIGIIIQSMIYIDSKNRTSINNLPINTELYIKSIFYSECLDITSINMEFRKKAIQELEQFIKDEVEENDREYLPLGLLLFDRLCSKNFFNENNFNIKYINRMYIIYLFYCYYISCKFLLGDMYIETITEYLCEDVDDAKCSIMEIIEFMKFDIYRPTILTFLFNENDNNYHTRETINTAIDVFCDTETINTNMEKSINELFVKLNSLNKKSISEYLKNLNITDQDIENSDCITYTNYDKIYKLNINNLSKPTLTRDEY
jgi:serine/threonine protein kinase